MWYSVHRLNTSDFSNHEIVVLENIYETAHGGKAPVRQRNLAKIAGISLGMTNVILKRLAQKGWLTIRRINSRNIQYAVSPEGLEAIYRKSYNYLRRTIKDVVQYKEAISSLVSRLRAIGYSGTVLVGKSDLEFIVEHACGKTGMVFAKVDELPQECREDWFYLFAENVPDASREGGRPQRRNTAFLHEILMSW
jgi:DNA-binding MarR family transcriptional regulator